MKEAKNIFLGGTCNESTWRTIFTIAAGTHNRDDITWFDPVVPDWTPECMAEEDFQKENCDIEVCCITPKMTGVLSIAEMVDASNKHPEKLVIILLKRDKEDTFTPGQWKSLNAVANLCAKNGCKNIFIDDDSEVGCVIDATNQIMRHCGIFDQLKK